MNPLIARARGRGRLWWAALVMAAAGPTFAVLAGGSPPPTQAAAPRAPIGSSKAAAATSEAPFLAENEAAMDRMMTGMALKPTGDVDRDFEAMMEPHHHGAIEMAEAELRYGRNEQLRRIAQEIIVTQQQEIAAMRLAVGAPLPPSAPSPTQPARPADAQSAPNAKPLSSDPMTMK